jgi:transposase
MRNTHVADDGGFDLAPYARRFREDGVAGLVIRPGRGRQARAVTAEVEQHLRQSPRAFGLTQTRWTLGALAQAAPSLRGFTTMGVWKVLQRAGFRYKRGQPYLHSPDPEYGEKKGAWTRLSETQPPILER